jgi:hypothetical protein
MARNFVRSEIRDRAKTRADMVSSPLYSDTEWNYSFQEALGQYWTLMDDATQDFAIAETTVNTLSGIDTYSLPANFRNLKEVFADEGNGQRRPILNVDGFSRAFYVPPQGAYPVIVRYMTDEPTISDDVTSVQLGDLGDGYVLRLMARDAMAKASKDPSLVLTELADLEMKIRSSRKRDRAFPQKSRNVENANVWLYPYATRIRGYNLLGDNIQLWQPLIPYYF